MINTNRKSKSYKHGRQSNVFSSAVCDIQGNLFLPSQVQKAFLKKNVRQSEADYHFTSGLNFSDKASMGWKIGKFGWERLSAELAKETSPELLLENVRTFAKDLFGEDGLGYKLQESDKVEIDERQYPLDFIGNGNVPIVLGSPLVGQDEKQAHFAEFAGSSNKTLFQATQELLNASKEMNWGMTFNGKTIRLLRDSLSLTRPSYVEFSLEDIFSSDNYSEFLHLYAFLHGSRTIVQDGRNVWEDWIKAGVDEGEPARETLSIGIKKALQLFGEGFLKHRKNDSLREALQSGALSEEEYLRELLRLMYRYLFVFCLEERNLINTKEQSEESFIAREHYKSGYSLHRFRERSLKTRFRNSYDDAWDSVRIVFKGLSEGEDRLALPALGGLFSTSQCKHLDDSHLENRYFYEAMELMRWATIGGVFTVIDYKNMGPEELGSIYESLLELVPVIDLDERTFKFADELNGDNTRKNSGSYYTPDAFVKKLISTTLVPVIEKKLEDGKSDPETALLSLRVIDPACGSGHFLLGAARTIADYLARVRSHNEAVSPEHYRIALRDVIAHCIYGVDFNGLAVELARMALWLEGFSEGHPLTFLDHHLKVGNSVVGVLNLESMKKGIQSVAYKTDSKDSEIKDLCKELQRKNTKGLKALAKTQATSTADLFNFEFNLPQIESIDKLPTNSLSDERIRAQKYKELVKELESSKTKQFCDLYMAGYLAEKLPENKEVIPTTQTLTYFVSGQCPSNVKMEEIQEFSATTCRERKVFNWPIEFAGVFAEGGFDCVLGNPPWEKPKIEDVKWFAYRNPEISGAKTAAIRSKMISALSEGKFAQTYHSIPASEIQSNKEKELFKEYQKALQHAKSASVFCHLEETDGGRFPLTGKGDTNLFAYFAELATQLLKETGAAGLVTPPGLLTDDSTKKFAQYAFNGNVKSFYHFENKEKFFPIDSRYSFSLITFGKADKADCVFYASRLENLEDERRHILLGKADTGKFNPNTKTCVLFRTKKDYEIVSKIYKEGSILYKEADGNNPKVDPWDLSNLRMFDMANDSGLFHTEPHVGDVPLYEGKMIHQFDDRWATFEDSKNGSDAVEVSQKEKEDPEYMPEPRFWVSKNEVIERFTDEEKQLWWNEEWMLACRSISSPTNQRTLIVSALPSSYGAGHSINLLLPFVSEHAAACLLTNLNSIVVDYVMRIKQSGMNSSLFLLKQLPILSPKKFSKETISFIVPRVARLTRNSSALSEVWLTDYPSENFQEKKVRLQIRAELDAYIAHLYKLTREELQYILDPEIVMGEGFPSVTFPGLKRDELTEYGEYLTQRLVLEAYDRLEAGTLN